MLDLKFVLMNQEYVRKSLSNRGFDIDIVNELFEKAQNRGRLMFDAQSKKSELTRLSKLFAHYKNEPRALINLKNEIDQVKAAETKLAADVETLNKKINDLLVIIPNLPLDNVPIGENEDQNVVLEMNDSIGRGLVKNVLPHYEIAKRLDMIDIDRAVKLSGSRYVIYKNTGAKLVRALINFMLDLHHEKGYQEFCTPVIVNENILFGTGQLPKFKDDLYKLENSNQYLIPTAEVTLTNIHNNEIIDLSKPFKATAYTECFRSEAGSSGKDTRGLIRQHQFKKIELVKITNEETAMSEFRLMLNDAKEVLEKLQIPYRSVQLCTGDLGFSARTTIDLELWLPSEQRFRETSSVSYMGDFQSRRAMIRYKDSNGETKYAHTMNGSGLAVDRVIAALLEIYQNEDGTITIPEALIPYMGGMKVIK
ncbi:serine--tRNA ligase [Mycoplasmopsis cynos]|uniref:Serine--tRNA ligase n=1 Tax=Mycoplasmopsis cynos TaxID=171284 RepID=A0ABD8AJ78_9BACT|nr:serine--tRNA ligase [Mycoplasmopsis cynos]MCU9932659.1 serine--tRNA ligase [Mycoplasmopsis cynos]MCU9935156.1 serine--tRNA ligase [Mycoplasmopsis cynos]WAM08612.1 serine--tRNA ligase [Mycoplasmopsis cynos]WQQ13101.1 serine--tRNA ligase [Mycoplasmopsis cynos]WQQ14205.1 serine--tRNA ligase [Mycoplasmopsis cynos]